MSAWRYLVFAEPGGGFLGEIELAEVSISRVLSGPGRLTGTLRGPSNALTILRPYAVSIWAEDPSGTIRAGGLLMPMGVSEGGIELDVAGLSCYPSGQPWLATPIDYYDTDPADIFREIWRHLQALNRGNIGVVVDNLKTGKRVGERGFWTDANGNIQRNANYTQENKPEGWEWTEPAPVRLAWWETHDLGAVLDDMAVAGGFEYREDQAWNASRTAVERRLTLGRPSVGTRRSGPLAPRLSLGENLSVVPSLGSVHEGQYATDMLALGAGEGAAMVSVTLTRPSPIGVRKAVVLSNSGITDRDTVAGWGRGRLQHMDGEAKIESIGVVMTNFSHGQFDVGDEIFVSGESGFVTLDKWVRITQMDYSPESTATVQLTVEEC